MTIKISNSGKCVSVIINPEPDFDRVDVMWYHETQSYRILPTETGYKLSSHPNGSVAVTRPIAYFENPPPIHPQLEFPSSFDTNLSIGKGNTVARKTPAYKARLTSTQPEAVALIVFNNKDYTFSMPTDEIFDLLLSLTRKGYGRD